MNHQRHRHAAAAPSATTTHTHTNSNTNTQTATNLEGGEKRVPACDESRVEDTRVVGDFVRHFLARAAQLVDF
jgi:hypothetical protein